MAAEAEAHAGVTKLAVLVTARDQELVGLAPIARRQAVYLPSHDPDSAARLAAATTVHVDSPHDMDDRALGVAAT